MEHFYTCLLSCKNWNVTKEVSKGLFQVLFLIVLLAFDAFLSVWSWISNSWLQAELQLCFRTKQLYQSRRLQALPGIRSLWLAALFLREKKTQRLLCDRPRQHFWGKLLGGSWVTDVLTQPFYTPSSSTPLAFGHGAPPIKPFLSFIVNRDGPGKLNLLNKVILSNLSHFRRNLSGSNPMSSCG